MDYVLCVLCWNAKVLQLDRERAKPIPVLGRALGDLKQGNVRRRVARNVMLAA